MADEKNGPGTPAEEEGARMDDETTVKMLKFLLKEKGLRVVTDERSDVPERELEARAGNPLADPRAYVLHEVVRLDGPDAAGRYTAWTAEGDRSVGFPRGLLRALTKHAQ